MLHTLYVIANCPYTMLELLHDRFFIAVCVIPVPVLVTFPVLFMLGRYLRKPILCFLPGLQVGMRILLGLFSSSVDSVERIGSMLFLLENLSLTFVLLAFLRGICDVSSGVAIMDGGT